MQRGLSCNCCWYDWCVVQPCFDARVLSIATRRSACSPGPWMRQTTTIVRIAFRRHISLSLLSIEKASVIRRLVVPSTKMRCTLRCRRAHSLATEDGPSRFRHTHSRQNDHEVFEPGPPRVWRDGGFCADRCWGYPPSPLNICW